MPGPAANPLFHQTMEAAGFFRSGRPIDELVWSADDLLQMGAHPHVAPSSASSLDRAFKYAAVIRPESARGRLGASHIFELSGSPCILFKSVEHTSNGADFESQVFGWQRAAWNDGRAPMLWLFVGNQLHILNSFAEPPLRNKPSQADFRRLEIASFDVTTEVAKIQDRASRQQIVSGEFWRGLGSAIDRRTRVDKALIRDINAASEKLVEAGLGLEDAHRLLLRSIFAVYLQERGWLTPAMLKRYGAERVQDAITNPHSARQVFGWLATTFNGDVFPGSVARDYSIAQLRQLKFFLSGGNPATGQAVLFPYEFDVLPIELLSSIYERFAHALNPLAAARRSTHYTPVNLVDLTLSQVFDDDLFRLPLSPKAKVLDLACGSGVFLVEAFRRLVARRVATGENWTRKLVRDTLYNQLYGLDINRAAISVAAISLYLAALELDPEPLLDDKVKFEPLIAPDLPAAGGGVKKGATRTFNLHRANAFDETAPFNATSPFRNMEFDIVVGNPPWTRPSTDAAGSAVEESEESKHIGYCSNHGIALPFQNPPDQAFMWRGSDFSNKGARFGLILAGRRFFSHESHSVAARRDLLLEFSPKVILNLSQLRQDGLFASAIYPALIIIAEKRKTRLTDVAIVAAPRRSSTFKKNGLLEIRPEFVQRVSAYNLSVDPTLLKVASWGTARDQSVLEKMRTFVPLQKVLRDNSLKAECGFTRGVDPAKQKQAARGLWDLPCLEEDGFQRFSMRGVRLPPLGRAMLERRRDPEIYQGPLLLLKLGTDEMTAAATFSERSLVFSQRFRGIHVPDEFRDWAECLSGIINSRLATYFLFLTCAEWGVERDNVFWQDLAALPVPPPEMVRSAQSDLLLKIASLVSKADSVAGISSRLDAAVYRLYGLTDVEQTVVDDFLDFVLKIHLGSPTPGAERSASPTTMLQYAEFFIAAIDQFLGPTSRRNVEAAIFELPDSCECRAVRFRMTEGSRGKTRIKTISVGSVSKFFDELPLRDGGTPEMDPAAGGILRLYRRDEVYVIKPQAARLWTRTAGLNDADMVLQEQLGAK